MQSESWTLNGSWISVWEIWEHVYHLLSNEDTHWVKRNHKQQLNEMEYYSRVSVRCADILTTHKYISVKSNVHVSLAWIRNSWLAPTATYTLSHLYEFVCSCCFFAINLIYVQCRLRSVSHTLKKCTKCTSNESIFSV